MIGHRLQAGSGALLLWFMSLAIALLTCSPALALPSVNHSRADLFKVFKEANDFFRQAGTVKNSARAAELYNKALLRYEHIVQEGVHNGKLYYNIGNTYFRLHDLGRAVLNYRRAQRYMANDENLDQNLAFALSRQEDKIVPKQEEKIMRTLLFWHYDLPQRLRWWIFGTAYLLFWGIAAFRLARHRRNPGFVSLFPLLVAMLMGGSLLANYFWPPKRPGVLVAKQVVARKGDGLSYQPSFTDPLHAGLDFGLIAKRGDWLQIELRNGQSCWVPASSAEMI